MNETLFPYKRPHMKNLFSSFAGMLASKHEQNQAAVRAN